jgi:transcriptional antiterminator NusG
MFEEDDLVRVVAGPFASFIGVVEEVDAARSLLKVALQVFGRVTRVELEFGQVESKVWPARRLSDIN